VPLHQQQITGSLKQAITPGHGGNRGPPAAPRVCRRSQPTAAARTRPTLLGCSGLVARTLLRVKRVSGGADHLPVVSDLLPVSADRLPLAHIGITKRLLARTCAHPRVMRRNAARVGASFLMRPVAPGEFPRSAVLNLIHLGDIMLWARRVRREGRGMLRVGEHGGVAPRSAAPATVGIIPGSLAAGSRGTLLRRPDDGWSS